jgi:hypothetical protein
MNRFSGDGFVSRATFFGQPEQQIRYARGRVARIALAYAMNRDDGHSKWFAIAQFSTPSVALTKTDA